MTPRPSNLLSTVLEADPASVLSAPHTVLTKTSALLDKPRISADNRSSETEDTIWIFGYGSLCWKPDFQYMNRLTGYIRGYSRKFWQGNTAHRGTPGKPGRVATLIEERDGEVWGVGYEVERNSTVLDYLWERECLLGGYHLIRVTFYAKSGEKMQGLAYLATPQSPGWLGCASITDIAEQIAEASGPAGTNTEYVSRLAVWIRNNTPVRDPHLDLLDTLVRSVTEPIDSIGFELIPVRERIRAAAKRLKVIKGKSNEYSAISRTQA